MWYVRLSTNLPICLITSMSSASAFPLPFAPVPFMVFLHSTPLPISSHSKYTIYDKAFARPWRILVGNEDGIIFLICDLVCQLMGIVNGTKQSWYIFVFLSNLKLKLFKCKLWNLSWTSKILRGNCSKLNQVVSNFNKAYGKHRFRLKWL